MTAPREDPWEVGRDDEVCVIDFVDTERRTLTIAGAGQLAGLLAERADRDDPPVVVLVVGVLHAELLEVRQMGEGRNIRDWAPWLAAITGLETYPSATVVAVPDQASCGGLELSLAADIRVAAPTARLGVLETRMGILPGAGGTQRLPALIGAGNAALLVLTGEPISGTEAHRMGLVQLVADDAVAGAIAIAERLAAIGAPALGAAKRALAAGRTTTEEGFREEGRAFLSMVATAPTKARIAEWLAAQADGRNPALSPSPLP